MSSNLNLWIAPLGMVLGGIEFDGQGAFWQTWHVTPWDRSSPAVGRPRHLATLEEAGYCRDTASPPALRSSNAQQAAPLAEPTCQQEASTAQSPAASKTTLGASTPG